MILTLLSRTFHFSRAGIFGLMEISIPLKLVLGGVRTIATLLVPMNRRNKTSLLFSNIVFLSLFRKDSFFQII